MNKFAAVSDNHALNNFDAIRAVAAFSVIVSHAFPITFGDNSREPLYRLTDGQATIGTIGVAVFFTISGYLITRSFLRGGRTYGDIVRFVRARALRIMPALVAILIILALVIGPIFTTERWVDYFSDVRVMKFIFMNITFLSFHDVLPGVFANNPFPDSIDGSLWTLRHEVRCYALVLIMGVLGLLHKFFLGTAMLVCLIWAFHSGNDVGFLFACFLAGAALYTLTLPIDGRIAAACICIAIVSVFFSAFRLIWPVFGSYAVIWLALSESAPVPRLAKYGDFSYGIYIFAFPIQQIVAQELADRGTWFLNVLISAPITLVLAVASWFMIERPSLALKSALTNGRGRSRPSRETGSPEALSNRSP
jgi:peptidoglycan/LPS O-acetylase OafA/YrhL